jgi:hypothetical protein
MECLSTYNPDCEWYELWRQATKRDRREVPWNGAELREPAMDMRNGVDVSVVKTSLISAYLRKSAAKSSG